MMQFNELVKGKKAHVQEAPITGGLEALKKGQMTVFMAGEKDLAEQVISIYFIIFLIYNHILSCFSYLKWYCILQYYFLFQLRPLMKACFQTIIYTGEFGTAMYVFSS